MNCRLCNKPLYMKYDYNNFGKLKGKWTCECGHGLPKYEKLINFSKEFEEAFKDVIEYQKNISLPILTTKE